jgi:hypothetical protein
MMTAMAGGAIAALIALLAAQPGPPARRARPVLVATAVPPLSAERLADALRTYLDAEKLEVRTAPVAASGDLRAELADTARMAAELRASLALRVAEREHGTIEIELMSLAPQRALLASMPRPVRDEDFYRALALKVQVMVRSLAADEEGTPATEVTHNVTTPAPLSELATAARPAVPARARRRGLQMGYTAVAFPAGRLAQQGIALRGIVELGSGWRLWLGTRALTPLHEELDGITVRATTVPLLAGLEHWWVLSKVALGGGALLQDELRRVRASAKDVPFYESSTMVPGAGISLGFHVVVAPMLRLGVHAAVAGLLASDRYLVGNEAILDASRIEAQIDALAEIAVW